LTQDGILFVVIQRVLDFIFVYVASAGYVCSSSALQTLGCITCARQYRFCLCNMVMGGITCL